MCVEILDLAERDVYRFGGRTMSLTGASCFFALPIAAQGDTFEESLRNLYEAVEGCMSVDVSV
jgi:hypothetical protein